MLYENFEGKRFRFIRKFSLAHSQTAHKRPFEMFDRMNTLMGKGVLMWHLP